MPKDRVSVTCVFRCIITRSFKTDLESRLTLLKFL